MWLNWQAQPVGQTESGSSGTSVVIRASRQGRGLYSDSRLLGELDASRYRIMLAFPPRWPRLGLAQLAVVERVRRAAVREGGG